MDLNPFKLCSSLKVLGYLMILLVAAIIAVSYYAVIIITWAPRLLHGGFDSFLSSIIIASFHILLVLLTWSYFMVVSRDPGSVPANWKPASENNIEGGSRTLSVTVTPDEMERRPVVAYCSQCQNGKPPRCHHCSVCQKCVLKMDHHCVWVVNCVGACNYKFFLLFVLYTFLETTLDTLVLLPSFIEFFQEAKRRSVSPSNLAVTFLAFVLNLAFALSLLCFIIMHASLISSNTTSVEVYEKKGAAQWKYDLGRKKNFEQGKGKMSGLKKTAPAARTRIGKYEIGKTLGEGSFAKVKYARDIHTGHSFAIKVIPRDLVLRHELAEQIKREISTMKLIQHPNVLNLIEVMASKTKIYIVLEYVDGGELFDKIAQQGRLSEDEARGYFQQLINAVDYCHSRGVYHRDLKPENLLLDSFGTLKVSDFGLSALSQQLRGDGLLHTACGTPNYVAPEVLTDRGYDGTSSDVWSCGVILFVLMAGYLPFDEPSLPALYRMIQKADFTCPPWFSSSVKELIKHILVPDPRIRMTIPEILESDWFKKGYKPPQFEQENNVNLNDIDAIFNDSEKHLVTVKKEKPESLNAFELISKSQGFSLENLFEKQMGLVKRETSFASKRPPNEIMFKIEEAAKPLGFNVHKRNYKMKLKGDKTGRKGHLAVATEVFEVAPSVHMVELRKTGGDTLEFHKFYKSFSSGLKDIVWTTEPNNEEKK